MWKPCLKVVTARVRPWIFRPGLAPGSLRAENRAVRSASLVLVLAVAFAGCGGDEQRTWPGPQRPLPADGTLPVEAFVDYAEDPDVDERWERSPALAAAEYLRLDEAGAPQVTIESDAGPEGGGPAQVTVTLDRLLDDSIQTQRFVLDFTGQGETWRLDRGTWSQRCKPGRGHQDFSPENCV
jgi:hypothetical protein